MGLATRGDGTVASASFDNAIGLWQDGAPRWLEGHAAAVTTVIAGPDGTLYSGSDDFTVRAWGDAPRVLGTHLGKVRDLALDPRGGRLASGSWDGTIRVWSLEDARAEYLPSPGSGVNAVAYSPDGAYLYAGTSGGVIWRYGMGADGFGDGDTPYPMVRHGFGVNRIVLGAGWLAYGAVDGGTRVIDRETGAQIADFTLERRPILAMAHHPGTDRVAVGDGEGYIMLLDTAAWRIARDGRVTRQGPVWALAFSPDGSVIHAGGIDDIVYNWPVAALGDAAPASGAVARSFLRDPETMPNGERQFMRKCSICHAVEPGPSRRAGPTLYGLFGRPAGAVPGYPYSDTLADAPITWDADSVDALFREGPDNYIPGSKMPMQVIAADKDRDDLIAYLKDVTGPTGRDTE